MATFHQSLTHSDYTVGWVCALPKTELVAASAMLDEEHPVLPAADPKDTNAYCFGRIEDHNVVIACLPAEQTGKVSAANVAKDMIRSFPAIRFGLMVGIGGGAPYYGDQSNHSVSDKADDEDSESENEDDIQDIRLGDVVVSLHSKSSEAVVQYDFGKSEQEKEFVRAGGQLNKPPGIVLSAVSMLQSRYIRHGNGISKIILKMLSQNPGMAKDFQSPGSEGDMLFKSTVPHRDGKRCKACRGPDDSNLVKRNKRQDDGPLVHYGTIGSADTVMKDAVLRDKWAQKERIKCFEMEAAGLMDSFPCLVIRGICDYADSHKNKAWQPYASATAAAYAKDLLLLVPGQGVLELPTMMGKFVSQVVKQFASWRLSDEENECLQSFRTSDYEYQKTLCTEREDGTCQWFLHDEKFCNWFHKDTSCLLWVTANPGCGKSVLSKSLVDERFFGLAPVDTPICYFFFNDRVDEAKSPTNALAALLHQVLQSNNGNIAMKHALLEFRSNDDKISNNNQIMWRIVENIVQDPECGPMIFVLDALDECESKEQKNFITRLKRLEQIQSTHGSNHRLKILVTSRPYWEVEREFNDLVESIPGIRIEGEAHLGELRMEMKMVVHAKLSRLGPQIASDAARNELAEGILATDNCTYLWLHFVFEKLREKPRIDKATAKRWLEELPKDVNDVYNSILIKSRDQDETKRLLQIIVAAARPLLVEEIGVALFLRESHKTYRDLELQFGKRLETTIQNACGLFIHIVDGTVRLIHQSAKDYLLSPNDQIPESKGNWKHSLSMRDSQSIMATICIWFLRLEEIKQTGLFLLDDYINWIYQYTFLEYASAYWAMHFDMAEIQKCHQLFPFALELCTVEPKVYMPWMSRGMIVWKNEPWSEERSLLHIATLMGPETVVRHLLSLPETDTNHVFSGSSPLQSAIIYGRQAIVTTLLDCPRVDVNYRDPHDPGSKHPLHLAILRGNHSIISLMLSCTRVDVNFFHADDGTPLHVALCVRDQAMVSLLLNCPRVDVNLLTSVGNTLLDMALCVRDQAMVSLLLSCPRVDVNLLSSIGHTPLHTAICGRDQAMVSLLLSCPRVDVNLLSSIGNTSLHTAIHGRDQAMVSLLLNCPRVDVNLLATIAKDAPLYTAIIEEDQAIVSLLLNCPRVDVNLLNNIGSTFLEMAIYERDQAMVSLLLNCPRVDVNLLSSIGNAPIHTAIYMKDQAMVSLLLNCPRVDVNFPNARGLTPLRFAKYWRFEAIIPVLLDCPRVDGQQALQTRSRLWLRMLRHSVKFGPKTKIPK